MTKCVAAVMAGVWQHLDAAVRLLGVFLSLRPSKHFFAAKERTYVDIK